MVNLLYCFDTNYNLQAFTSIFSFLSHSNEKIKIHIIHKDSSDVNIFPKEILNHRNLSELKIYKFDRKFTTFPNIDNAHVSEATYYRIFFDDYIEGLDSLETLIYVDSDMICLANPFNEINKFSNKLLNSEYIIAAKNEIFSEAEKKFIFSNLELTSDRYLNAGFLIIDVNKWINRSLPKELSNKVIELKDKIVYWDQDVFNSYFDGSYLELPETLNMNTDLDNNKDIKKNSIILHYYGKTKPWNTKGILNKKSKYYQNNFRLLGLGDYHITHKRRILSIRQLGYGFLTLKIFFIYKPFTFLKQFFISLFR